MKYFTPEEFKCKCGRSNCNAKLEIDPRLATHLDTLRSLVGFSLVVNSGLRCEKYNLEVGGVGDSAHVDGLATDISVVNSQPRFQILEAICKYGLFRRIGIAKTFIHVDVDTSKDQNVVWLY